MHHIVKKGIATCIAASLILGSTGTAFAATSTDALIAQLQAQITALHAKVTQLKAAETAVQSTSRDINATLKLIGDLREGMTSEQVALLQTVLAADSTIYPEGKVTGYYGAMTKKAVKRFQERHGISSTGNAGPLTQKKLNELLKELGLKKNDQDEYDEDEDDDRDDKKSHGKWEDKKDGKRHGNKWCLPPGHLVAAGWKKNHGNAQELLLPLCNKKGDKGNNGTTTPPVVDMVAPSISGISASGVTHTGASISWTTNEAAQGKIYLSTTSPVSTSSAVWTSGSFLTSHMATLAGLLANTSYRYVIGANDATGNKAFTAEGAFTTAAAPDTTAPILSAISGVPTGSTTANVSWTTNEAATTKVYYGTATPLVTSTALFVNNSSLVSAHTLSLSGLSASTTYYVIVESRDAANNTGVGAQFSLTTGM